VTKALQELVDREEIDRAFRRYGLALADIDKVFPDNILNIPVRRSR
jgi:hypothetical protein